MGINKNYVLGLINDIAKNTDRLRDSISNLQNIIGYAKMQGETFDVDGEEIDTEMLDKFQEYLEEIRKFSLYV